MTICCLEVNGHFRPAMINNSVINGNDDSSRLLKEKHFFSKNHAALAAEMMHRSSRDFPTSDSVQQQFFELIAMKEEFKVLLVEQWNTLLKEILVTASDSVQIPNQMPAAQRVLALAESLLIRNETRDQILDAQVSFHAWKKNAAEDFCKAHCPFLIRMNKMNLPRNSSHKKMTIPLIDIECFW